MKKVVIFGGGSGLSQLLKGLVQFPLDITAVVSVADNGSSTGVLRNEFSIPAVGDITKVLMAMSSTSKGVKDLFNYRFSKESSIGNHSIKNLIMTALLEQHKDFAHSLPILCDLLDVKGNLLPLCEDNVDLIGITKTGKKIIGEEQITESKSEIVKLKYSKEVKVLPKVLDEIKHADLIIFSSGSLITSIMPHIIVPSVQKVIRESHAKKMYVCNIITQPGETDNYTVSDHINKLEEYLGKDIIDVVIANNKFSKKCEKLALDENKKQVVIDKKVIENKKIKVIEDSIIKIEDGFIRHDSLKTAYLIFSYLMDN